MSAWTAEDAKGRACICARPCTSKPASIDPMVCLQWTVLDRPIRLSTDRLPVKRRQLCLFHASSLSVTLVVSIEWIVAYLQQSWACVSHSLVFAICFDITKRCKVLRRFPTDPAIMQETGQCPCLKQPLWKCKLDTRPALVQNSVWHIFPRFCVICQAKPHPA